MAPRTLHFVQQDTGPHAVQFGERYDSMYLLTDHQHVEGKIETVFEKGGQRVLVKSIH